MCIAGVADQLQTNFAADLRQILRAVFLINCSPEDENRCMIDETKSDNRQGLFEFRGSFEENVFEQNIQGTTGSQQSICSAEEVNPESDDGCFEENDQIVETQDDDHDGNRKRRYGNRLNGRSVSLSDDATTSNGHSDIRIANTRNYSISESPLPSYPQSPPKWIPDHQVPKCMSCKFQFTAFRRRHHCRNCGKDKFLAFIRVHTNFIPISYLSFHVVISFCRWNILWSLLINSNSVTKIRINETSQSLSRVLQSYRGLNIIAYTYMRIFVKFL